jgi:hypothetical protein
MYEMMKKEQLLRRLEHVDLPEILVQGHKDRLRMVLLNHHSEVYLKKTMREGSSSKWLERAKDWLGGTRWRMALASTLSLAVIGTLLAVFSYLSVPAPAVLAADIVKRDPGIQQKLSGTGDIIIVRVEIRDHMASVVCGRSVGDFIEADVDMEGRSVVTTRRYEGLFIPEISLENQNSAARIAMKDSNVKAMLDKGGTVGKIFPIYSSISNITITSGNLIKVTPAAAQAVVPVYLDTKVWLVQVNLETDRIEKIIEPQSSYYDIYYLFKQI